MLQVHVLPVSVILVQGLESFCAVLSSPGRQIQWALLPLQDSSVDVLISFVLRTWLSAVLAALNKNSSCLASIMQVPIHLLPACWAASSASGLSCIQVGQVIICILSGPCRNQMTLASAASQKPIQAQAWLPA